MLPNLGALSLKASNEAHDAVPTDVVLDDWKEAIKRHEQNALQLPDGVEEEDDCAICLGPLKRPPGDVRAGSAGSAGSDGSDDDDEGDRRIVVLDCMHAFHYQCAANWFRSNHSCAKCRKPISIEDERDLRALAYDHQPLAPAGAESVPQHGYVHPRSSPVSDFSSVGSDTIRHIEGFPVGFFGQFTMRPYPRQWPDIPHVAGAPQYAGIFEQGPPTERFLPRVYRPNFVDVWQTQLFLHRFQLPEFMMLKPPGWSSEDSDRVKAVETRALAGILHARLVGLKRELRQGPPSHIRGTHTEPLWIANREQRLRELQTRLTQAQESAEEYARKVGLRLQDPTYQWLQTGDTRPPANSQDGPWYRWYLLQARRAGVRLGQAMFLSSNRAFEEQSGGPFEQSAGRLGWFEHVTPAIRLLVDMVDLYLDIQQNQALQPTQWFSDQRGFVILALRHFLEHENEDPGMGDRSYQQHMTILRNIAYSMSKLYRFPRTPTIDDEEPTELIL